MPSTTSSVVSIVLDSSTVMTPSLPTFFMASAMMPPICLSLLAEMVPTCAIMSPLTSRESFLISSTATSTARSMPRLRPVGLEPAATVLTPSRKMAWASTVAVVVPSPATSRRLGSDFANHLRAHVLERVAQFDFLGNGHAVLGDDRRAELLFDHRIAALGAEGDLHCVGKSVHAAQNRLAGILTCYNLFRHTGISS